MRSSLLSRAHLTEISRSVCPRVQSDRLAGWRYTTLSLLQMASRLATNGNRSGHFQTNYSGSQEDIQMKSESSDMETNQADGVKAGEYVRELLKEKMTMDPAQTPNAMRLLDQGKVYFFNKLYYDLFTQ